VALDLNKMSEGNHTIEFRGLNEASVQSLPVFIMVSGTGDSMDELNSGWSTTQYVLLVGALVVLCLLGVLRGSRIDPPLSIVSNEPSDSVDAVLAADADLASAVDAVLVEDEAKSDG
jgi:hypothetical protein